MVFGTAAAKVWREELGTAAALLDASEIQAIWGPPARPDKREATEPAPPTALRLYWTAVGTLLAAVVGVLVVLYTVRWTGTTWSGYAAGCLAMLVGGAARRNAALRYPALAWITGAAVITIALICLQLVE